MSTNTARRIRLFIEEELLDGDAGPDDPIAVGFLDSLAAEQLIAFAEETFGITFEDEAAKKRQASLPLTPGK